MTSEPENKPTLHSSLSSSTFRKAVDILTPEERRNALRVISLSILAAILSAMMVWSLLPFLSALSDPEEIHQNKMLSRLHRFFGAPSYQSFLLILGLVSVLIVLATSAIQILRTRALARMTTGLVHSLGHQLLHSYLNRPWEFFLKRNTSDMASILLTEAEEAVRHYYRPLFELITGVMTTSAVVIVLALVNAPVAILAAVVVGVPYYLSFIFIRRRMARAGRVRSASNRARFKAANEALRGIKDIRILRQENSFLERFTGHSEQVRDAGIVVETMSQMPRYIVQAVIYTAFVFLCLSYMAISPETDGAWIQDILPLIGVLALAAQKLIPELSRLYSSFAAIRFGAPAIEHICAELNDSDTDKIVPKTGSLEVTQSLSFKNVSYSYPTSQEQSIKQLSFSINSGERIGIAGASGAGKTTFGDLTLGLIKPSEGEILVDGTVIDDTNRRAWQQNVGFVPQDIFLSDASIAENIAFGALPDRIDTKRMEEAGRAANLYDLIQTLPEGYQTLVGERGLRLSGGQRQRIAIARSLYKGADLIVFDEATSALDNLTETEVMAAIDALPEGKTILIIAHRLTTLRGCNRILVLEKGCLAGFDSEDILNENCPAFRSLSLADVGIGEFVQHKSSYSDDT